MVILFAGAGMQHQSSASVGSFRADGAPAWALIALALAVGLLLALGTTSLPAPAPKSAPADAFSAARAMDDVRAIAVRPHPIGSAEIERTRAYLMTRMRALGLDPQIRDQTAITTHPHFKDLALAGRVRNIVGELKGGDPSLPAVMVMAHYDTVPHSPGAGDDTSGVAVALEVARALKASGGLRRPVIFVMTDGEEAGLLGASAFFHDDPVRKRVGLVINLEARGDNGRSQMFQTSPNSRGLIEVYRDVVRSPSADSLTATLYKRMPNDTDLTIPLMKGYAGLNFAFAGNQMAYHTPVSTPESLNPGSLQHMGDQVLPVVRAFAQAATLPKPVDEMVYADLLGLAFVSYPSWFGWLLGLVAVGTAFGALGLGIARRRIGWGEAARGAGGLLALLLGIAAALLVELRLAAFLLRDVASPYALVAQFGWLLAASGLIGAGAGALLLRAAADGRRRAAALWLLAAGLLCGVLGAFSLPAMAVGLVAALLAFVSFGRPAGLAGFFAGAVALVALLAAVLQVTLPSGAHALVWPLLPLAAISMLLVLAPERAARPAGRVAIAVAAALLVGLLATQAYGFFVLMGPMLPMIVAPFVALGLLGLAPLFWSLRGSAWTGAAIFAAGIALCAFTGIRGRTPTPATPELVQAFYLTDADRRASYWAAVKPDPSGWTKAVLEQDGGTARRQPMEPIFKDPPLAARARPAAFVRPMLDLSIAGEGAARRIALRVANANGGRYLQIFLRPSVDMAGLTLEGRALPNKLIAGEWSQFPFYASGADPVTLTSAVPGTRGRLDVELIEVRDGWPAGARVPARPANVVPIGRADTSMILARSTLEW